MKVSEISAKIVTLVSITFVSTILNGYVMSVLWDWFVVPTFNLPHLSIVQAIGIVMIIDYLKNESDDAKKDWSFGRRLVDQIASDVVRLPIYLLFGYVVHLLM